MPSHQERQEDIAKLTVETILKYLQEGTQQAASSMGNTLNFAKVIIETQVKELCLLRELEDLLRELDTSVDEERVPKLYERTEQVLAQLDLFRRDIAEKNATQENS